MARSLRRLLVLLPAALWLLGAPALAAPPLRVLTFNIRYGTAKDGENHWDKRKEFLVETIREFNPDLLGTQETLGFQRDYLAEQLPEYAVLGVGRDDGQDQGEMMALYYKKSRFQQTFAGHFWLSDSPATPGSKSWDTSLPRMATWVRLADQQQTSAPPIFFLNTHFDHRGPEARLESARLIRRQLETLATGCSIIITGDFNSGEGSPPYQALFAASGNEPSPVVDAFRIANPERGMTEGTATGFDVNKTRGARIDWIACSRDWKVIAARINRADRNGRPPSDHFPVEVILER